MYRGKGGSGPAGHHLPAQGSTQVTFSSQTGRSSQPLPIGELLERYAGRLYQLATFLFNDEDAAMQVEQSFLNMVERVRNLPAEKAGPELVKNLARGSASLYRARYGDRLFGEQPTPSDLAWLDPFSLADWGSQPVGRLGRDELQELLRRVLHQLRPNERLVFVLHDVAGLSDREICEWLGLDEKSAHAFLQAARLKTRDRLNAEFQAIR